MPHLTHIALHVEDLEACSAFYREFCSMAVSHERGEAPNRVRWLAEPGKEHTFVFVLLEGGSRHEQPPGNYGHLGFACASRSEVDDIAARAKQADCLVWRARDEPQPLGYYCGVQDPNGNCVEFSHGQPLGPAS